MILASDAFLELNNFDRSNAPAVFWSGFGLGCLGTVILAVARFPLYRERKFFAIGPKQLPPFHRKLYWLAYIVLAAAMIALGSLWWRIV